MGDRARDGEDVSTRQGLSTATRSWDRGMNRLALRVCRRNQPRRHPDFRLLASRMDKIHSSCFQPFSLEGFVRTAPRKVLQPSQGWDISIVLHMS